MAILDFSFSGRHGFGSVTQVCFGISVPNFVCTSFVAVGRSLMIVSYVAFKMAALWFWTMFNCNPPIAHCYPLLWGGGILVDHGSTISSYIETAPWWPLPGYYSCTLSCDSSHCNSLTGWPRSGWPRVGHFDQKIKGNQIASYCAMLYPRCCTQ